MSAEFISEIVFPDQAGNVLGYSQLEMAVLVEFGIIASPLLKRGACGFYYKRSELIEFRNRIYEDAMLAASVRYLLSDT